MIQIQVDGKLFNINLCNFNKEREFLNYLIESYDKEQTKYNVLWEVDRESTREEILSDIDAMNELLNKIEQDYSVLEQYVRGIRKKKNGMLWRNSGEVIKRMDHCAEFFTDFTNAWSTPELRLDVIDESTCQLSIRARTYTY